MARRPRPQAPRARPTVRPLTNDPVGTAVWSLAAGATTGAVVMTAGVFLLRLVQTVGLRAPTDLSGLVLGLTVLGGIAAAAGTGWIRTEAINDLWRRGVTAASAVFGAALLTVAALLADTLGGTIGTAGRALGLALYLAVLVLASLQTHRRAQAAATR